MTDPRTAGRLSDAPLRAGIASLSMLAYAAQRAPDTDEGARVVRAAFRTHRADRFTVALANGRKAYAPPAD